MVHGVAITRDGGISWRPVDGAERPQFSAGNPHAWQRRGAVELRVSDEGRLMRRARDGAGIECMTGWRIPIATWRIATPSGTLADGPGGAYLTEDGERWSEVKLWRESETGAADYLHAFWMGRYYRFVAD